eukprot:1152316-Pelagomonas_calceolata.AAC.11
MVVESNHKRRERAIAGRTCSWDQGMSCYTSALFLFAQWSIRLQAGCAPGIKAKAASTVRIAKTPRGLKSWQVSKAAHLCRRHSLIDLSCGVLHDSGQLLGHALGHLSELTQGTVGLRQDKGEDDVEACSLTQP